MSKLYITIDTEYSAGLALRDPAGRAENFARSIACQTPQGAVGLDYQMDWFDRHGIKAVFFVDPAPALIWGQAAIDDVVGPVIQRGHDVQLHFHSEWLELAGSANPLRGKTGRNIKDFAFEDQCTLLDWGSEVLIKAGAPRPVAFRAGNYGANDDTLRALATLGMTHDSSHAPGIAGSECAISLGPDDRAVRWHHGVIEAPTGCIAARGAGLRHAQLTALSAAELLAALAQAQRSGQRTFTLVSHSFELLSRDRKTINRVVQRRFERICQGLAGLDGVQSATYAADPPQPEAEAPLLPHSPWRTTVRQAKQAFANALYGRG